MAAVPTQQLAESLAKGGMPTAANTVDHKIPHRGDEKLFWRRSNWQSLRAPCHSGEKQREEVQVEADGGYLGDADEGRGVVI